MKAELVSPQYHALQNDFFETEGVGWDNGNTLSYWQRIAGFEEVEKIKVKTNLYNQFTPYPFNDQNKGNVSQIQDVNTNNNEQSKLNIIRKPTWKIQDNNEKGLKSFTIYYKSRHEDDYSL